MQDIIGKLIAALIGALILWLISSRYNRSQLYCFPLRLYEYSNLIDGGATVQLVIANRGRKTEEAVEVQLSPDYKYHLLAATQNGVEIPKDNTIKFSALLPNSEVSLIVAAEGKPSFSTKGIRSIRSKHAKGIVAESMAQAEADSPGFIPALIFFVSIIVIFDYFVGTVFGEPLYRWSKDRL